MKYKRADDVIRRIKAREPVSVLELSCLGRELGIDIGAISKKHIDAEFHELLTEVKQKLSGEHSLQKKVKR